MGNVNVVRSAPKTVPPPTAVIVAGSGGDKSRLAAAQQRGHRDNPWIHVRLSNKDSGTVRTAHSWIRLSDWREFVAEVEKLVTEGALQHDASEEVKSALKEAGF